MPVMALAAGAAAGSSLLGGYLASEAAGGAADELKAGALTASNQVAAGYAGARGTLLDYYNQAGSYLQPFGDIGTGAMRSFAEFYGLPGGGGGPSGTGGAESALTAFRGSPEYQLPLQEGLKAVEYSRAAQGALRNPATAAELMKWGQTYASSRLDSYLSRLMQLAGIGQSTATTQAGNAINVGGALGQLQIGQAQAQSQGTLGAAQAGAAGQVAQGNIWSGTVGNIGNTLATGVLAAGGPQAVNPSSGTIPGLGTFYPGYTGTPAYGAPPSPMAYGYGGWPGAGGAPPFNLYALNNPTGAGIWPS